jgi:DNA-directed RNA polymerase subunit RPC12/RpoP
MNDIEIACPHCNRQLEVPAELAGQVAECPACQGRIQLPARASQDPPQTKKKIVLHRSPVAPRLSAPTESGPRMKNCPHCGEQILATATKCKHCKSEVGFAAALEQTGKAMEGCGCALTLLVTVPILIFLFHCHPIGGVSRHTT